MNRRLIFALLLVGIAPFLRAQDKASTPKPATPRHEKAEKGADKTAETPKVLIFQPVAKLPDAVASTGSSSGVATTHSDQSGPMADGPAQIVGTFFGALREGKVDEGYGTLTKDSKIAEKPEELRQLKAKTREAIDVFGAIAGFDFVESRAIGQRLVRATYVSQGKVFPLRWRFYFYKPENDWRLIDMRVDDKLTGLFDEPEEPKDDGRTGVGGAP